MPLFQSELFIMRIPGRSNISRKTFFKLSNCFANQENEKKLSLQCLVDYSRIFEKLKKKDKKDLD